VPQRNIACPNAYHSFKFIRLISKAFSHIASCALQSLENVTPTIIYSIEGKDFVYAK